MSVFESSSFAENYKDAKLLGKRSKFITEREREKKKDTIFFCIFLEMQGHKEMRILQC